MYYCLLLVLMTQMNPTQINFLKKYGWFALDLGL